MHGGLEAHDTSGIDAKSFAARKIFTDNGAAGMDKGKAGSGKLLQDKAFAAEKAGSQSFCKGDINIDIVGST
jgi:hypothetical protein